MKRTKRNEFGPVETYCRVHGGFHYQCPKCKRIARALVAGALVIICITAGVVVLVSAEVISWR